MNLKMEEIWEENVNWDSKITTKGRKEAYIGKFESSQLIELIFKNTKLGLLLEKARIKSYYWKEVRLQRGIGKGEKSPLSECNTDGLLWLPEWQKVGLEDIMALQLCSQLLLKTIFWLYSY